MPHRRGRDIRAEVEGFIVFDLTDHLQTRPGVLQVQLEKGIVLVILEDNVVSGLPLLHEIRFEDEGLELVVSDDDFHIHDLREQTRHPLRAFR